MKTTKFAILLYIVTFVFPVKIQADCLLPEANSFAEFVEKIEMRDGWKNSISKHAERLSKYKYKSKIDSLFEFANGYFEERLPTDIICSRVDVNQKGWFSFFSFSITMRFVFYLDLEHVGERDGKINVNFIYTPETDEINVYFFRKNFWIPNCKEYPDSCKFEVITEWQARDLAKSLGYLKKGEYPTSYTGRNAPPFCIGVSKTVDDDCGMQCLFINSYNKDTLLSARYRRPMCQTWKEKIDRAEIVIDGTIIDMDAFSLNGEIFTSHTIEVHYLFKGDLANNVVTVISEGGSLDGRTTSVIDGGVNLGFKHLRQIFFLSSSGWQDEKLDACSSLLGKRVYFARSDAAWTSVQNNENKVLWITAEENFSRIEKITGKPRRKMLHPQTFDEDILKKRRTIPDREDGIAAFLKISFDLPIEDSVGLVLTMAGTNDFYYLENWESSISYDSLAFGTWLVKNQKIRLLENHLSTNQFAKDYDLTVSDDDANTIKFRWQHKTNTTNYPEMSVLGFAWIRALPIVVFKVSVVDATRPMNLKLSFTENPVARDFSKNKTFEIPYQFTSKEIKSPLLDYKEPIIANFYPKEAAIGDTITIEGEYFGNVTPSLLGRSLSERSFFRRINKKFIITHTENKIVFMVPPYMQAKYRPGNYDHDAYLPVSNYILLAKPRGYGNGAYTKENLIIKDCGDK